MEFVCPRCQHRYQGSENLVGKEVRCKNAGCELVFKVAAAQPTANHREGRHGIPPRSWYVATRGSEPVGPFTSEELIRSCDSGRLDADTLCWCEGAPRWLPVAQVEPFASAMHSARAGVPPRRHSGAWIAAGIVGGGLLIVPILVICSVYGGRGWVAGAREKPGSVFVGATPKGAREPPARLFVEPLTNGVVIDDDLSVSVARFERHVANGSRSPSRFLNENDDAQITLAVRRLGGTWVTWSMYERAREFRVIITDDRGNEYEGGFNLEGGLGKAVEWIPAGFTWTGKVLVSMPKIAPAVKVELKWTRFGAPLEKPRTSRVTLDIARAGPPNLAFEIPKDRLLPEGTVVDHDKNLIAEVGRLTVHDSFAVTDYMGRRMENGLSLSVPIKVTNGDYNAHQVRTFGISVQFENGEVSGYPRLTPAEEIPGKSVRTLLAHADFPATMEESRMNVRAVLLYGPVSGPGFPRFIPIPDDVRKRIREIANSP